MAFSKYTSTHKVMILILIVGGIGTSITGYIFGLGDDGLILFLIGIGAFISYFVIRWIVNKDTLFEVSEPLNERQTNSIQTSMDVSPTSQQEPAIKSSILCLFCGTEIKSGDRNCSLCNQSDIVRGFPISQGQQWTSCYNCGAVAEYKAWIANIQSSGQCPKCKTQVTMKMYQDQIDQKSLSQKIAIAISKSMGIEEADKISNMETAILDLTNQLTNATHVLLVSNEEIKNKLNLQNVQADERHSEIIHSLEPIIREITHIQQFVSVMDGMNKENISTNIIQISDKFDIIESQLEVLVEAHAKSSSTRNKIKNQILGAGADYGTGLLVEQSGIKDKIKNYLKLPNKDDLQVILGKIGEGIKSKTSDPRSWLKLASFVLLV